MMMLSVVHGFRSKINGNAEVSATGPTSRVNLAAYAYQSAFPYYYLLLASV